MLCYLNTFYIIIIFTQAYIFISFFFQEFLGGQIIIIIYCVYLLNMTNFSCPITFYIFGEKNAFHVLK